MSEGGGGGFLGLSQGGGDFLGWVSEGGGDFSESCTQKTMIIVWHCEQNYLLYRLRCTCILHLVTYILCPFDIFFESCNVGLFLQHHSSLVGQLIQALSVDGIRP